MMQKRKKYTERNDIKIIENTQKEMELSENTRRKDRKQNIMQLQERQVISNYYTRAHAADPIGSIFGRSTLGEDPESIIRNGLDPWDILSDHSLWDRKSVPIQSKSCCCCSSVLSIISYSCAWCRRYQIIIRYLFLFQMEGISLFSGSDFCGRGSAIVDKDAQAEDFDRKIVDIYRLCRDVCGKQGDPSIST